MRIKISFIIIASFLVATTFGQQSFCADSSFRIKYIFGDNGATLYNNPDTLGKNFFTGSFLIGNQKNAIALLKTTWGDSMLWAKKIYANGGINISSFNSVTAPDGSIVCTGAWGNPLNASEFLICKIDTSNGKIQWIKHFKASQNHINYGTGDIKNITITNNSIYLNTRFVGNNYSIIAKLDFNGNIIWSRGLSVNLPNYAIYQGAPIYLNNTVLILNRFGLSINSGEVYPVLTKLNDTDGSIIESLKLKSLPDTLIKGVFPLYLKYNTDNSISLTGLIEVDVFGSTVSSNIRFNTLLDPNFNVLHNYYYTNNIPLDNIYSFNYDFNNKKQHAILASNIFNSNDKYFVTFGKNDEIQRSRKFIIPASLSNLNQLSVNLDDKENLHFLFHYPQNNKLVTEYARISNLAPNGTLGCFGKDTSILTRYPFTLTKEPFVWDNIQSNVIVSNDVPYTEDTAIVTKELVCKIVSRCDSVHINGPAAACVGVPVRYTVSKNSGCFKNLDWNIDTAFATIINTEGDSAITINFKKTFTGYIRAALTDCVVKDSFFVAAVTPIPRPLINRADSLLCPGKTLLLTANNGFSNYIWQGSINGNQLTVSNAGLYKITAADSCGTIKTDSITITYSDTSLTLLPLTQTICLYDTAFIQLPADLINIMWQPIANSLLRNKIIVAYPTQNTVYNITAERQVNCPITKTASVVIKICPETVFIPNAFTPNKNGLNDIFKPTISQPLPFYRLIIYNRYGQTVFTGSNQNSGWDGTYKGKQQPMGGYIYQCGYRFAGKPEKLVKGYFILVR